MMYQIHDIIDFSLIKENQFILNEKQCNVYKIIENSIALVK